MKPWAPAACALVALLLLQLAIDPTFFAISVRDGRLVGSLLDVLLRAAPTAILAVGIALIIATGAVDLSVGAIAAITGAVAACLTSSGDTGPLASTNVAGTPLILLIAISCGVAGGLFNGFLVAYARIQPVVATLILMTGGRGLAQWFTGGQIVTYQSAEVSWIARGNWLYLPIPVWIATLISVTVGLIMINFPMGRLVAATGANPEAAEYVGISVPRLKLALFGFSGFCAAVSGLIWSGDIQAADSSSIGLYSELDAILAVAIGGASLTGGKFSIASAVLGAVLMRLLTTMLLTRGVSQPVALVLMGVLVIGVCAVGARRRIA